MPDQYAASDDSMTPVTRLANDALALWPLPKGAVAQLLNLSENTVYLVSAPGWRGILRVHRAGYQCRAAIEQELAWAQALGRDGIVPAPRPLPGVNGELVQQVWSDQFPEGRFVVMFDYAQGCHPNATDDLTVPFSQLGAMAAKMHLHAQSWPQPPDRLRWDDSTIFGNDPIWGDWREAPNVSSSVRSILERTEDVVRRRLAAFGKSPQRYGLIHADMRLANLLIDGDLTRIIDFDDCGISWFLYDFAASISFIEDHPQVPELRQAWVASYRRIRPLSDLEEREIDTFIMLRRMALLAWIGSHRESTEPQALAPHFAEGTARLASDYLSRFEDS